MAIELLMPLKLRTESENTTLGSVPQELFLVQNCIIQGLTMGADLVGYISMYAVGL